ncbi:MAG: hypothetical protein ACHRXM_11375 [Isosphaerales bacterium]
MAQFADRMKTFTEHLRASIQTRNEARKQIHAASVDLFNRTQAFMSNVADEHRTRAQELRETMAEQREECRQKAADLRENHQESLQQMRGDLNEMLSETRRTRQDTVNELFHTFQHARNELALDLHEASNAWQAFAAGRDKPVVAGRHAEPVASRGHAEPVSVHAERFHSKPEHGGKPAHDGKPAQAGKGKSKASRGSR